MSDKKQVHTFAGKRVEVDWDGRLCIHVGECTRAEGGLFESGRKPWGEPDRAEPDQVDEVVRRCPTGALTVRRKDGGAPESAPATNTVVVANNGPLYVSGALEIAGAPDDMPGVRTRAALCRCGDSNNKPFCDNSHRDHSFHDAGAIGEKGPGIDAAGETLDVKPVKDGPLIVTGNLTLIAGTGRRAWQGDNVALCRCGQSANKPFCDGMHSKVGFKSD
jgi:CDGSH-type Zn-finger protein/uncharacterized Fe-S cluster protein YjdI